MGIWGGCTGDGWGVILRDFMRNDTPFRERGWNMRDDQSDQERLVGELDEARKRVAALEAALSGREGEKAPGAQAEPAGLPEPNDAIPPLGEIIDIPALQSLMDDFYALTHMVLAILDLKGHVLVAIGWQDICTRFHRIHPEASVNCTESDLFLTRNLRQGEFVAYKCKNHLWDVATPLYVDTKHVGNIYTGQFFYDDEIVDEKVFVEQADRYGFDRESYLQALRGVPRYSRRQIDALMGFLTKLSVLVSELSFRNLELARSIEEQQQTAAALRKSENMLRATFNATADGILVVDKDGEMASSNAQFASMWGIPPNLIDEGNDERTLAFILEQLEDPDSFLSLVRDLYDSSRESLDEIRFKDGRVFERFSCPVVSDGNEFGRIWDFRDVTERKRTETEKAKLQGQLLQSQKMESVGRLAGGVAHDFNNMLGVIIGHAEMAIMHVAPDHPMHFALLEIRKAAERSADLTRQLLAFARKQTASPKVLDLNDTVGMILKMVQRLVGEDIQLVWRPGFELWKVRVDPSQVDQILANLCVNARDAIDGIGRITIETENVRFEEAYCADHMGTVAGEFIMLAVSDDGCGMDKEVMDKLFEPFFTTKGVGKGTGLGLATVYGIVKQNEGFINVYSEPDRGSTFKVYLPRYRGEDEKGQTEGPHKLAARGEEMVLVVEDEPAILNISKLMLESQGYRVLTAATPAEAIRLASEHAGEIRLLITDVVMPEMNGRDLANQLRILSPNLKSMFMSGYTADVIAHHGVLDEGVYFIQKPFSMESLTSKVREALDRP